MIYVLTQYGQIMGASQQPDGISWLVENIPAHLHGEYKVSLVKENSIHPNAVTTQPLKEFLG